LVASLLLHLRKLEDGCMAETTRRKSVEQTPLSEDEAKDEVVNDSLGTVDTADANGLETDEAENKGSEESGGE
jgi:hypothetical protein